MNANTQLEVIAKAFQLMTGNLPPYKDVSVAELSDLKERQEAYDVWYIDNQECINAMLKAFEEVYE